MCDIQHFPTTKSYMWHWKLTSSFLANNSLHHPTSGNIATFNNETKTFVCMPSISNECWTNVLITYLKFYCFVVKIKICNKFYYNSNKYQYNKDLFNSSILNVEDGWAKYGLYKFQLFFLLHFSTCGWSHNIVLL